MTVPRCVQVMALSLLLLSAESAVAADPAPVYDIVISGGRVLDPETGLDGIRNIGIVADRIEAISQSPLRGKTVIGAKGLVVGPGFIDLHSHAQNVPSAWVQAFDGVTTAMELEIGAWPVGRAYEDAKAEGRPINYGFSSGWLEARKSVLGGRARELVSEQESASVVNAVEEGLREGGIGIGLPVGYAPDSNRKEYLNLGKLAALWRRPTFTHVRTKNTHEPRGAVEGFEEVLAVAAATGAQMHICHVNSSALRETPLIVDMISSAQKRGVPVTSEAYPWGAGTTFIAAPFLRPDNLPLLDITPSSITYLKTGERPANADRLRAIQAADPDGFAVIHYLNENDPGDHAVIDRAVLAPDAMIASDAVPYTLAGITVTEPRWPLPSGVAGHPRTAATFTTLLAYYARDHRLMPLMEVFRRGALEPARLLEGTSPAMRDRGRVQIGAVADLILFDPEKIVPRATYEHPARPSTGMRYVLVSGKFLIAAGALIETARHGVAIRGSAKPGQ